MPHQIPVQPASERHTILNAYAEWTVLSALRQAPRNFRSREKVYSAIRRVGLGTSTVLRTELGAISPPKFNRWHSETIDLLVAQNPELRNQVGWAAKIINIYLKTYAYVGDGGRPGLRECLHPPIDGGLWDGVRKRYSKRSDILSDTHCVSRINQITSYGIYQQVLRGLGRIAAEKGWMLIEVESLWEGTVIKKSRT